MNITKLKILAAAAIIVSTASMGTAFARDITATVGSEILITRAAEVDAVEGMEILLCDYNRIPNTYIPNTCHALGMRTFYTNVEIAQLKERLEDGKFSKDAEFEVLKTGGTAGLIGGIIGAMLAPVTFGASVPVGVVVGGLIGGSAGAKLSHDELYNKNAYTTNPIQNGVQSGKLIKLEPAQYNAVLVVLEGELNKLGQIR